MLLFESSWVRPYPGRQELVHVKSRHHGKNTGSMRVAGRSPGPGIVQPPGAKKLGAEQGQRRQKNMKVPGKEHPGNKHIYISEAPRLLECQHCFAAARYLYRASSMGRPKSTLSLTVPVISHGDCAA